MAEEVANTPVEVFSNLPEFQQPKLSPSGTRLAFLQNFYGKDEVTLLKTFDMSEGKLYGLLASDNQKVKINWFRWANDERLVVSVRYESKQDHLRYYETRLYSLNFDEQATKPLNLIDWRRLQDPTRDAFHTPQFQDNVISWLPDDPDHILLAVDIDAPLLPTVYKVNINNAKMSRLIRGKLNIRDWIADQQGNVRIGVSLDYESGESRVLLREEDEWRTLFAFNAMKDKPITPLGFAADSNILYYKAYKGNYRTLYKLNLADNTHTEVLHDEGADVDGGLIYSSKTRDAIGIYHSRAENGEYHWQDTRQKFQKALSKALPDVSTTLISFSEDEQTYILFAESDTNPGQYFLGDRKTGALKGLFTLYSELDMASLPKHKRLRYQARDGVEIEGYLTLPTTGEAPFPTIIHPHGGPGARDYGGFDYWTAYFSNRGYAVFRPNFRGSSGYGYEFSQAQMKGWGLEMQDDITDAANWMIDEGYANPEKMCIVGASYGGYAAMMATVKTPDLFTCAVSFAGVSELDMLLYRSRGFANEEFVENQIGDDDDDLDARSPITFVEKIKTPILLIHGDEDRSVHVEQSRRMANELEDYNKTFKYVELESGDHYLSIQKNRHKAFAEMDAFLSQYLTL
ncbi:alpha/beta hydrolase family protein [Alteromonas aestuariivivens]|nr:S9 family peptidase [Alteromonas aestuariivivens]